MLAGHLAFMSLLALFPFLIFLLALAGFVGQTDAAARFVELTLANLPPEVAETLRGPVEEIIGARRGGLLTFGIVASLWSAGSGLEALRTAVNRAYGVSQFRPMWARRLESFLLVVLAAFAIILAMLLLVLGPQLWEAARALLHLPEGIRRLWLPVQYGAGLATMLGAVCAVYFLLPNVNLRLRWILPGAALAVAFWLLAASVFSLYLANFGSYAVTYGSLGGVVGALFFFYISAAILLFGAELNAAILRNELGSRAPRDGAV